MKSALGMLIALATATTAFGAGFAPDADTFDPVPALRQQVRVLFPESKEASPVVTAVQRIDRFMDGYRTEIYEVRLSNSKVLGQIMRFQAFLDPVSQVDLALRTEAHKLVAITALRPIRFGQRPFTRLKETFAPLKGRPLAQAASALATVFHALSKLKQAELPPAPVPTPKPGTPPLVSLTQETLPLGSPIPAFELTDTKGTKVSSTSFRKQIVVFVLGTLSDSVSCQMLDGAARVLARRTNIRFVPCLKNLRSELEPMGRWLTEPDLVLPRALLDPNGSLEPAFRVPNLPYLFIFDSSGRLVFRSTWGGDDQLAADVQKLFDRGLK